MKKILRVSFIIISFLTISVMAQLPVDAKMLPISSDYNKYVGKQYIYTDVVKTFEHPYFPPFPYKDGRIRDGKYKASETALNNYLKTLSSYYGKRFTVVKFQKGEFNIPGAVMACENGDTLFFQGNIIDMQFIEAGYFDSQIKKKGKKLRIINNSGAPRANFEKFYGCTNVKDGSLSREMPIDTEWKINSVSFDTTYVGEQSMFNDSDNYRMLNRFKYTIENKQYGIYECFPNNHPNDFEIAE